MTKRTKRRCSFLFASLFIALIFSVSSAQSSAGDLRFVNQLSTLEGLVSNEVRQVFQDSEGYIWIATREGLCRFDGYRIKTYKSNLYTPDMLSNNRLNVIAEDHDKQIWIGTDNGLNILDKTTGTVRKIASGHLRNNSIQAICVTRSDSVWIGTENGLYRYDAGKDSFALYDETSTGGRFKGYNIKSIYEDYFGNIWIGTWSEGLARIDCSTGEFHSYPQLNEHNKSAHFIFEDNSHNIWIVTWGNGLVRLENPYDAANVRYIAYKHDGHPGSLSDNTVYALAQDRNTGRLWVGSRSGLHVLNDVNNPHSFVNYLPGQSDLPCNEVNSIICDNTGLMWLGFLGGGVSTVNTAEPVFAANLLDEIKKRKLTGNIRSIMVDDKGMVWMGIGNSGLALYNPATDRYTFMEEHPDFIDNPVYSVHYIKQTGDAYWFSVYGQGVFVYRPGAASNRVKQFSEHTKPALTSSRAQYIYEDSNHLIWIGTFNGLSIYHPETGEMELEPSLGMKNSNKQYTVTQITQSDRQTVWVSTSEDGVFRLKIDSLTSKIIDSKHYSIRNGSLNNNHIQCIFCDSKGRLWAGSHGGGLSLFDERNEVFVCMQQEYNLPGDFVSNIIEDRQGSLWLGTISGLVRLKDGKASLFTVADGLPDIHFNPNTLFLTPSGEIFVGSHNGYSRFNPASLNERRNVLPAAITDIFVFNHSLETLDPRLREKISTEAAGYTEKISLPYKYNNFSIEFATLNYLNPQQSKYAYKLDGYDYEWQYVDATKRIASYNNLKDGNYVFYLKSLDESGSWSEPKTLKVEILPPFWLTWWAFVVYFALSAVVVVFILKIVRNRLLLMNEIRIKEMEKQQIEALNQERLRFYTNITHELRTPLTLILGPLEDLLDDSKLPDYYHSKIKLIYDSATRLLNLINRILEFRKTETQNRRLTVVKGDLGSLVKEIGLHYRELNHNARVTIRVSVETDRTKLYFDPEIITTILNNLLSNAVKYTAEGEISLTLSSTCENDEEFTEIRVSDTGCGISPDDLPHIFDRYYQAKNKRQASGTGIGLALVKSLADLHKGYISVKSRENEGATFIFRIPTNNTYADSLHREEKPATVSEYPDENIADENKDSLPVILVIEDDNDIRNYTVESLSAQYKTLSAANGKEGLELAQNCIPNIIVSDIMMPEMDGIELCRKIKKDLRTSHIPVILLTAKDSMHDKEDGYISGADSYLTKPFGSKLLHARINNLLESRRKLSQQILSQAGNIKPEKTSPVPQINKLDEEFMQKITDIIEKNISKDNLNLTFLSAQFNMSQSTLYRKIKGLTGISPNEFIRKIRLKNSLKLLISGKYNVSEAAGKSGFVDTGYFRECFREEYGQSPTKYLKTK